MFVYLCYNVTKVKAHEVGNQKSGFMFYLLGGEGNAETRDVELFFHEVITVNLFLTYLCTFVFLFSLFYYDVGYLVIFSAGGQITDFK